MTHTNASVTHPKNLCLLIEKVVCTGYLTVPSHYMVFVNASMFRHKLKFINVKTFTATDIANILKYLDFCVVPAVIVLICLSFFKV